MSITQTNITKEVPIINSRLSDKCPECTSKNLVHDNDTGETICGDCGLVVYEQMMDKGPEWRAFTQEEKTSRSRVGMPTSYSIHDKGLSTLLAKLTEMHLEENCRCPLDCRCGALGNGKYAAEYTHPSIET